jgi:hypothetical protein
MKNQNLAISIIAGSVIGCLLAFALHGCSARVKSTNPPHPEIVTNEQALGGPSAIGIVSWSDDECKAIHKKTVAYTAVTAAFAGLSGVSGAMAGIIDQKTSRWITGSFAVSSAIISAVIGVLLKSADDDFSTGCRVATEPEVTQ